MDRMEFFERLELKKGGRVLNLGCAAGRMHDILKRKFDVVGADCARPADVVLDMNKGLKPFKDREFAAVVAGELIEHLDSPLAFLKECRRVLADGGELILTTPNADSMLSFFAGLTGSYNKEHVYNFNKGSLALLLDKAGFKKRKLTFLDATARDGNCGKRPLWAVPFQLFTWVAPGLKFHLCAVAEK